MSTGLPFYYYLIVLTSSILSSHHVFSFHSKNITHSLLMFLSYLLLLDVLAGIFVQIISIFLCSCLLLLQLVISQSLLPLMDYLTCSLNPIKGMLLQYRYFYPFLASISVFTMECPLLQDHQHIVKYLIKLIS